MGHDGVVALNALSPDGTRVLSWSMDETDSRMQSAVKRSTSSQNFLTTPDRPYSPKMAGVSSVDMTMKLCNCGMPLVVYTRDPQDTLCPNSTIGSTGRVLCDGIANFLQQNNS